MTPPQLSPSGASSAGPRISPWVAVAAIAVALAIWTVVFASLISAHVNATQSSPPVALSTPHTTASTHRL